jgi:hypothetical protein
MLNQTIFSLISAFIIGVITHPQGAEAGPSCAESLLSGSQRRQIVSYLRKDSRRPPKKEAYFDAYSRYEDPEIQPSKTDGKNPETKGASRTWFYPKGDIGSKTYRAMDMGALDFPSKLRTKFRINTLIQAPFTDVTELKLRQGALKEFMTVGSLLGKLKKLIEKPETEDWLKSAFADDEYHHPEPKSAAILYRPPGEEEVHEGLRRNPERPLNRTGLIGAAQNNFKKRIQFFKDVLEVLDILKEERVQSARLRQILWILESVSGDKKSGGTGEWIRQIIDSKDLLTHENLVERASDWESMRRERSRETLEMDGNSSLRLGQRLSLLIDAFSEVIMYYELAQHAHEKKWTTFPQFIDPKVSSGPVLSIEEGHSLRTLQDELDGDAKSIPNSVQIGSNGKRHLIVTGPNAQGKSTALRMVGQLLTLAQMGLPVPAKSMQLTPMGLIVYLHPEDNPSVGDSLFMAEVRELWRGVYPRAAQDPYQLVLMDEIAPGTIAQIRADFESVFLSEALNKTGVLSITSTHNPETTKLGDESESPFENMHVEKYRLLPGSNSDLAPMYEGAAQALLEVGVPDEFVQKFLERGRHRNSK